MSNVGFTRHVRLQPFLYLAVCIRQAFVLTKVLCPGFDEESLDIPVWFLEVAEKSPPECPVPTPNAAYSSIARRNPDT